MSLRRAAASSCALSTACLSLSEVSWKHSFISVILSSSVCNWTLNCASLCSGFWKLWEMRSCWTSRSRQNFRSLAMCDCSSECIWLFTNCFFFLALGKVLDVMQQMVSLKTSSFSCFGSTVPLFLHVLPFALRIDSEHLEVLGPSELRKSLKILSQPDWRHLLLVFDILGMRFGIVDFW